MQQYIQVNWVERGLRFSIAIILFSAVADRFGMWPIEQSAWGNWENFVSYTNTLNPWFPNSIISVLATTVTGIEIILAVALCMNYKIRNVAYYCAILFSLFGISMSFTIGVKVVLDYSVLPLIFAALSLVCLQNKK